MFHKQGISTTFSRMLLLYNSKTPFVKEFFHHFIAFSIFFQHLIPHPINTFAFLRGFLQKYIPKSANQEREFGIFIFCTQKATVLSFF